MTSKPPPPDNHRVSRETNTNDPLEREDYERLYLATDDPVAQSGFRGSLARWEAARRLVVCAIDAPGTLLDVGCANGLLMESIIRWSAHAIEPYGVDFAPKLVELAKRRLPHWRDRFFVGDVREWQPPRAFDYVHVRFDMCHLRDVRTFGGRAIVSSDGSFARPESPKAERVADVLRARGWVIAGKAYGRSDEHAVEIAVAWTP